MNIVIFILDFMDLEQLNFKVYVININKFILSKYIYYVIL